MISDTIKSIYISVFNASTMSSEVFSTIDARTRPDKDVDTKEACKGSVGFLGYCDPSEIFFGGKNHYYIDSMKAGFDIAVNQLRKDISQEEFSSMKYIYLGSGLGMHKNGNSECSSPTAVADIT